MVIVNGFTGRMTGLWMMAEAEIFTGLCSRCTKAAAPQHEHVEADFGRATLPGLARRIPAPHCGHIPPPFLHNRVGDAAIRGSVSTVS
jgi:hypothetical protein